MDKKLLGLVAIFIVFFGAFVTLIFIDSDSVRQLRAQQCVPSPASSVLFAFPLELTLGENTSSGVTVFVRDDAQEPCSDKTVVVNVSGTGEVLPQQVITDANGKASFAFNCLQQGESSLQASVEGVSIAQSVSIACN